MKRFLMLILILSVAYCKEKEPPALKHRTEKITAKEKQKIKQLLEAKDGLNLGILLKVIPANIDNQGDTERIVAYRKGNSERFTVLKPKGDDFVQLKGDPLSGLKIQIVDIRPVSLVSPSSDSILTVVRSFNLKEKPAKLYTHYRGGRLQLVLDGRAIMKKAAEKYLLPIDKTIKISTRLEDVAGGFSREFVIFWQENLGTEKKERRVVYQYQNGVFKFLPEKEEVAETQPEETVEQAAQAQNIPKKKTRAIINKPVIDKVIRSCDKIYKQVRKQCYDEVFNEEIDPDTDCEKTAKEARASCLMG